MLSVCFSTWLMFSMRHQLGERRRLAFSPSPSPSPSPTPTPNSSNSSSSCAAGKYSVGDGQTLCKSCDAGKYSDAGTGQTSPEVCKSCGAGKYGDQTALTECKSCAAGKYSVGAGQTSPSVCKSCGTGKYSDAGTGQTSPEVCKSCGPGKYGDQTALTRCKSCPTGKFSFGGTGHTSSWIACGSLSNCSFGFYANSSSVGHLCYQCQDNATTSVNATSVNAGRAGPMCGACISGYFKSGKKCIACGAFPWQFLLVLLIFGFGAYALKKYGISTDGLMRLKILSNFIQVMSLTAVILVSWPAALSWVNHAFQSVANFTTLLQPRCVFTSLNYYFTFSGAIFGFILTLCALAYLRRYFRRTLSDMEANANSLQGERLDEAKYKKIMSNKETVDALAVTFALLAYTPLLERLFLLMNCENTDSHGNKIIYCNPSNLTSCSTGPWLKSDVTINCTTATYAFAKILSVCLIILVGVGLPGWIFYKVIKIKQKPPPEGLQSALDDGKYLNKYGALYKWYTHQAAWFEAVMLVRKFLLAISVAVFETVNGQAAAHIVIALVYGLIIYALKPYRAEPTTFPVVGTIENPYLRLDYICTFAVVLSNIAIFLLQDEASAGGTILAYISVIVNIAITLATVSRSFIEEASRSSRRSSHSNSLTLMQPLLLFEESSSNLLPRKCSSIELQSLDGEGKIWDKSQFTKLENDLFDQVGVCRASLKRKMKANQLAEARAEMRELSVARGRLLRMINDNFEFANNNMNIDRCQQLKACRQLIGKPDIDSAVDADFIKKITTFHHRIASNEKDVISQLNSYNIKEALTLRSQTEQELQELKKHLREIQKHACATENLDLLGNAIVQQGFDLIKQKKSLQFSTTKPSQNRTRQSRFKLKSSKKSTGIDSATAIRIFEEITAEMEAVTQKISYNASLLVPPPGQESGKDPKTFLSGILSINAELVNIKNRFAAIILKLVNCEGAELQEIDSVASKLKAAILIEDIHALQNTFPDSMSEFDPLILFSNYQAASQAIQLHTSKDEYNEAKSVKTLLVADLHKKERTFRSRQSQFLLAWNLESAHQVAQGYEAVINLIAKLG